MRYDETLRLTKIGIDFACEIKDQRIADLEAQVAELTKENKGLSTATQSVEDWEMERCFRVRAERKMEILEAQVAKLTVERDEAMRLNDRKQNVLENI